MGARLPATASGREERLMAERGDSVDYYIRVLALSSDVIGIEDLRTELPYDQRLEIESGSPSEWREVVLKYAGGSDIALIERNPVMPGELGAEEIQEYLEEIQGENPSRLSGG